jgi:hypothetical protein
VESAIVPVGPSFVYPTLLGRRTATMLPLLLAVIFLSVVVATCLGAGLALTRKRGLCSACGKKGLKHINWFRSNPPPNLSYFACNRCGAEFVQVERYDEVENPMIPRVGSPGEHCAGWGGPDRVGPRPQA